MRIAFIILFYFLSLSLHGQIVSAIINDNDGFTNIRIEPNINSKVDSKIVDGQVFEYNGDDFFEKKEWIYVSCFKSTRTDKEARNYMENYISGYMHRSRVLPLDKIQTRIPVNEINDESVKYKNDSMLIEIRKRKLLEVEIDSLYFMDIWGTDTGNPKNKLTEVNLRINGEIIQIPEKYYTDLYRVNLENSYVIYYKDILIVGMTNSDGAGFYEVNWVIKNGEFVNRYISLGP